MADELNQAPDPFDQEVASLVQILMESGARPAEAMAVASEVAQRGPGYRKAPGGPLEVDIAPGRLPRPQRAVVGEGQYGLPSIPPVDQNALAGPQAEARSSLSPEADSLMGMTGLPTAMGRPLDTTIKLGRATGDAVPSMVTRLPMPWLTEKAGELAQTASDWVGAPAFAASPDTIKRTQEEMKASGYYFGDIDGLEGPETKAAMKRFQADAPKRQQQEAARQQQELEAARIRAQESGNAAETAKANAALEAAAAARQETARLAAAEAQRAAELEAGNQRLRDIEKNRSLTSQVIQDYAPALGYGVGAILGPAGAAGASKFWNALAGRQANRANTLITEAAAAKTPIDRAGAVNQFWSEGQKRPLMGGAQEIPFPTVAGKKVPITTNPNAPPSSELYQPNRLAQLGTDAAATGAFAAETVIASGQADKARAELEAARAALDKDKSEVNIQRYEAAKNMVAIWDGASNIGRVGAFTYPIGSVKRYVDTPARPNMSAADNQRHSVDAYLAGKGRGAAPQSKPEKPLRGAPGYRTTPYGVRGPDGKWSEKP